MKPEDYLKELEKALYEYRSEDVGPLTDQIDPSAFTVKQVKKALNLIRRKRLFSELEKTASLFFIAGHQAPVVRRQWAQAVLDQNRVVQGLSALRRMEEAVRDDPDEGPEVRGLIGRAYKQLYVKEGDKENLVEAILAYRPGWRDRQGDYRWHGINLVALLARAERDGVDPPVVDRAAMIARKIRDEIEDLEQRALVWDYGTAMEASVALDEQEDALRWARKYATHPDADAFELASTLRQMKEVWNLEGTELGNKLLPVLEYELLQREGSTLELPSTRVEATDANGFEAVYGPEGSVRLEWMDTMYEQTRSVARVIDTATGEPSGTGFLIQGSVLRKEWGDELVFVTNSHVISDNPANDAPLHSGEGSAEFTRLSDRPKIELGELLFSSPRVELDVSVLRIQAPDGVSPLKPTFYPPAVAEIGEKPQRIYVIGHPKGAELAISLYDNILKGYADPYVHYRSPTEGGSSGSPVLTRKLKLFALHHRTRENLRVNEGVLLDPIKSAASA